MMLLQEQFAVLCLLVCILSATTVSVSAFVPTATTSLATATAKTSSSRGSIIPLNAFKLPDWLSSTSNSSSSTATENGVDPDNYPWCFTGRLWFRPALVRVQDSNTKALEDAGVISILRLGGYTLGGTVTLDYDTSPVGPYKEYVSMGALVASVKGGTIMIGQWGSRLYVSTKVAEEICQKVWAVPAEVADIQFREKANTSNNDNDNLLQVISAPDPLGYPKAKQPQTIEVTGWSKTRVSNRNSPVRGGLPIWWTPSIKALWVRLVPNFLVPIRQPAVDAYGSANASGDGGGGDNLPLHRLRLSASSVSLQWCGQESSDLLGIPLPIGLSLDNVLIEIGRQEGIL